MAENHLTLGQVTIRLESHIMNWMSISDTLKHKAGHAGTPPQSNGSDRTSLMVQWLRIYPLMQGTQFQSLVQEDSTCRAATKPMHHSYCLELCSTTKVTAKGSPHTTTGE